MPLVTDAAHSYAESFAARYGALAVEAAEWQLNSVRQNGLADYIELWLQISSLLSWKQQLRDRFVPKPTFS